MLPAWPNDVRCPPRRIREPRRNRLPDKVWEPALDADGGVRRGGDVAELTGLCDLSAGRQAATGQLVFLEARHRAHARVEDRIRHANTVVWASEQFAFTNSCSPESAATIGQPGDFGASRHAVVDQMRRNHHYCGV